MEITRKAEYAISILVDLASQPPEQRNASRDIAQRQKIPGNFLPQIAATLSKVGWIEGTRGPGGGMRLIADPKEITLKDVVELIEGPMALSRCLDGECENQDECPLKPVWGKAQQAISTVLSQTSIWDLAQAKRELQL